MVGGYLAAVDGLLFTGGEDIAPAYFGEARDERCQEPDPERDLFEIHLARAAVERRVWIRDGVIMGAALLRPGCSDALRDFVRWYAPYQAEDGALPDCADREGTEWLPEFDAYGQLIFGVMEYYRFTGDRAFLAEMRPAVKIRWLTWKGCAAGA